MRSSSFTKPRHPTSPPRQPLPRSPAPLTCRPKDALRPPKKLFRTEDVTKYGGIYEKRQEGADVHYWFAGMKCVRPPPPCTPA